MNGVNLNFDARTVEPRKPREALPDGWYKVIITNSEMKATKDNTGAYLQLDMKVLEGAYAGHMVTDRLNLNNPNPTTVEIAYRTLSEVCYATGVIQVPTSMSLHNIPMEIRVTYKPASGGYDASNDVKAYRALQNGATAGGPPAGPFGAAPAGPYAPPATPQPYAPPTSPPAPPTAPSMAPPAPPAPPAQPPLPAPPQAPGGFTPPQAFAPPQFSAPQAAQVDAPPPPPPPAAAGDMTPPWAR